MKTFFGKIYSKTLNIVTKVITQDDLKKSALIFAPHPDDETLGCGGLILKKKEAGAKVVIVFVTDGAGSHRYFFNEETLISMRKKEALKACHDLNVSETDLIFLNFPDEKLFNYQESLKRSFLELINKYEPDQIFIPHQLEDQSDHYFTYNAVKAILLERTRNLDLYEYLVWSWYQWPQISITYLGKSLSSILKKLARTIFGLRLWLSINQKISIPDKIDQKQSAIQAYKSQVEKIRPDIPYPTLDQVGGGGFLAACTQTTEYYRKTGIKNNGK